MTKREIIDEWFLNVDSTNLKEGHFNAIELAMEEYAKQQLSLHNVSQHRELLIAYENYTSEMIIGKTDDRTAKSLVNDFLANYSS